MHTITMQDKVYEALHGTLLEGGLKDEKEALKQSALMVILSKIAKYESECAQFRKKYKIPFSNFKRRVKERGKENFEADDNYLDWKFAYNALKLWEERKRIIESA